MHSIIPLKLGNGLCVEGLEKIVISFFFSTGFSLPIVTSSNSTFFAGGQRFLFLLPRRHLLPAFFDEFFVGSTHFLPGTGSTGDIICFLSKILAAKMVAASTLQWNPKFTDVTFTNWICNGVPSNRCSTPLGIPTPGFSGRTIHRSALPRLMGVGWRFHSEYAHHSTRVCKYSASSAPINLSFFVLFCLPTTSCALSNKVEEIYSGQFHHRHSFAFLRRSEHTGEVKDDSLYRRPCDQLLSWLVNWRPNLSEALAHVDSDGVPSRLRLENDFLT